ncbi:hypothetical protein KI387_001522, partial [Taxus chinensis]
DPDSSTDDSAKVNEEKDLNNKKTQSPVVIPPPAMVVVAIFVDQVLKLPLGATTDCSEISFKIEEPNDGFLASSEIRLLTHTNENADPNMCDDWTVIKRKKNAYSLPKMKLRPHVRDPTV